MQRLRQVRVLLINAQTGHGGSGTQVTGIRLIRSYSALTTVPRPQFRSLNLLDGTAPHAHVASVIRAKDAFHQNVVHVEFRLTLRHFGRFDPYAIPQDCMFVIFAVEIEHVSSKFET